VEVKVEVALSGACLFPPVKDDLGGFPSS